METSEVVSNKQIAEETWQLTVENEAIARQAKPGQFVTLHHAHSDSVMRRPFSIWFADPSSGQVTIIFRVVGKNTRLYSQLQPGDQISVSGPCGKPIRISDGHYHRVILIGGGCGLGSLFFPACHFRRQTNAEVQVFAGFPTHKHIFAKVAFEALGGVSFHVATDDGSQGFSGTVVDLFQSHVKTLSSGQVIVFTCGPLRMMQAVSRICQEANLCCMAFLEQIMACGGVGSCKSCAVPIIGGTMPMYVCEDGSAFNAKEVHWNELIARS